TVPAKITQRGGDGVAALVGVDHPRVYVGRPGHRRGVAQVVGYLRHDAGDGPLAGAVAAGGALRHGQSHRREDCRVPGTEVLGGVVASRDLTEVGVDVRRADIVPARAAPVCEQPVAAATPPFEAPHGGADVVLRNGLLTMLGALGGVLEHELTAADRDVVLP